MEDCRPELLHYHTHFTRPIYNTMQQCIMLHSQLWSAFYNRERSEPGLVMCCDLVSPTHIFAYKNLNNAINESKIPFGLIPFLIE